LTINFENSCNSHHQYLPVLLKDFPFLLLNKPYMLITFVQKGTWGYVYSNSERQTGYLTT